MGEWSKIDLEKMSHEERLELAEIVSAEVPIVKIGDGVEVFQDYLPIELARSQREEEAIQLIADLRSWCAFAKSGPQDIRAMQYPEARSISEEMYLNDGIRLAIQTLEEAGIFLEWPGVRWIGTKWPKLSGFELAHYGFACYGGLFGTAIFWDSSQQWKTLRPDVGLAIIKKREMQSSRLLRRWLDLYPWRRCMPLIQAHRFGWLGINTPEDHAMRLLLKIHNMYSHEGYPNIGEFEQDSNYEEYYFSEFQFASDLSKASIATEAFSAGVHFEALRKKCIEYETVKARDTATKKRSDYGPKGGDGRVQRKRNQYSTLNKLAQSALKEILFASDRQRIRIAKRLAAQHDKDADAPLFVQGKNLLSDTWFETWLNEFLEETKKEELQLVRKK